MWQHDKQRIESLLYYLKIEFACVLEINYRPYTNWKWFTKFDNNSKKLEMVGIEYNSYSQLRIFLEGYCKGKESLI